MVVAVGMLLNKSLPRKVFVIIVLGVIKMVIDDSRQITFKMSSSGNAVLIYDEVGNSYMTSKKWMMMLLDGGARGNMIKANHIGNTNPKRYNNNFDPSMLQPTSGDPLSRESNDFRAENNVKVSGDDW